MASSGPTHSVFVYGSLMADEVVSVLLDRVPLSSSAYLYNFHRFSVTGRVYPAILPVEKKTVTGRVLMGLTDPELYVLDTFEDVEYERELVEVSLVGSSEKLEAQAYVWSNKDDPRLFGEWDYEKWRQQHMEDFIKMTAEFKEELVLSESTSRVETYENFYQQDSSPPLDT